MLWPCSRSAGEDLALCTGPSQHRASIGRPVTMLQPPHASFRDADSLAAHRALIEVAALEKASTPQHDACLTLLAGAVRLLYKAHQLAGRALPACLA